jgi:hypothetical protein
MLSRFVGTRRRRLTTGLVVLGVLLAGTSAVVLSTSAPAPPTAAPIASSSVEVPAPRDGNLVVATAGNETTVAQLAGTRVQQGSATQRSFEVAHPVEVATDTGTLRLRSGVSTTYTVVASGPGAAAVLVTVSGAEVTFTGATGKFTLSVLGNAGGTWQFVVDPQSH